MEKTVGDTVLRKPPNPTGKGGFTKGGKAGPGRGKKNPMAAAGLRLVEDMQRGYSTAESPTDSPIVKAMRKLAHEDPWKFILEYNKAAAAAGLVVSAEAGALDVGEKEVAIEDLAERLLHEWEAEDARDEARNQAT